MDIFTPGELTLKRLAPVFLLAGLAASAAASDDPEALLERANCGMCHQIENAMLGPSYQAIAERYADQPDARSELFDRMRAGSQGVWGAAPMPAVTEENLSDDDLRTVIAWMLDR